MVMIPKGNRWTATGKRKSAVARVILTPGNGNVYIRKWRKLPLDSDLTITYIDPKSGEEVEEKVQFTKTEGNKMAVPFSPRLGKKPYRYTPVSEYFGRETLQMVVQQPFEEASKSEQFDVYANVTGGGLSGQAGAIRHGISKALVAHELAHLEEDVVIVEGDNSNLPIRTVLKKGGFLTRDARVKERKKYGQPGARKRFQYSKR